MKTLYLHIGHYKTGSSAIQKYCSENADLLRAGGFLYPASGRPKSNPTTHGDLSLTLARKHGFNPPAWYTDKKELEPVYAEFLQACRDAPEDKIVVSSEEFVQLALRKNSSVTIGELKDRLAEFDVRIILYIREPMALLKSWYSEVNKGPFGTRPFPVFFKGLDPNFLSQETIYRSFADVFGADKMILCSYRHLGMDHIRDFLEKIGYSPLPEGTEWKVNEGRDRKLLELARLAKRRNHPYEEATLSNVGSLEQLEVKVAQIKANYEAISALADVAVPCELSLVNIYRHYQDLVWSLVESGCANRDEAVVLRNAALTVETTNLPLARVLMETAFMLRPGGAFIKQKLESYDAEVTQ